MCISLSHTVLLLKAEMSELENVRETFSLLVLEV